MMDMVLHKLMLLINSSQEGSTNRNLAIELVKHIDELKDLNIYEIADLCFVSTSTLSRFCRLLGYKNFNNFKDALENSYGFEIDYDSNYLQVKDNVDLGIEYMKEIYTNSIQDMNEHIKKNMLLELAKQIHEHESIHIFGNIGYQFLAMYLQERLGLFKKIIHISADVLQQAKEASRLTKNDLAIIVSPRGSSTIQSGILPILYKNGIYRVLVTQNEHTVYKDRYQLFIQIGGSFDNNLGMISFMYFIDQLVMIYYSLYHEDLIV